MPTDLVIWVTRPKDSSRRVRAIRAWSTFDLERAIPSRVETEPDAYMT
jgi:hypothetical protein